MSSINLVELHTIMKPLCLESKISEKSYDKMLSKPEVLPKLMDIYNNEWASAKKVKDLLPEVIWQRYKMFMMKDLREINMLREALRNLRKAFYKVIPNERQENTSSTQAINLEVSTELQE